MKGQFFSYDAIVAGSMFAVLLALIFLYWTSINSMVFNQADSMLRTAILTSETLLSPGYPENWTLSNVRRFGLTDRTLSARINPSKLDNFAAADYETLRDKLGLGMYQLLIVISNETSNVTIGSEPSGATGKITLVRPVIYNNTPQNMSITIWTNSTVI